jgi:hypothetical protein
MSTTYDLPLPNDRLKDGRTVVASCYADDDTALLLLLMPTAPFFQVAIWRLGRPEDDIIEVIRERNIVYAVRQYEQEGGDV